MRRLIRRYGTVGISLAVTLISVAGAVGLAAVLDVILKGRIQRYDLPIAGAIAALLTPLITIHFIRLSHQLDLAEEEMRRLASLDSLTQTYTRGHFLDLAEKEVLRAQRYGRPLSLLLLDIDHFKSINDRYGHSTGDRVLRAAVGLFRRQIRRSDLLGRYGGEEFVILLPETGEGGASVVAERIRVALREEAVSVGSLTVDMTVSIGLTSLRPDMQDIDALLAHADAALYRAKDAGRDRVERA
ncbi:MAG: GGDEF domain-containing protein [Anaerolineales bacterium]